MQSVTHFDYNWLRCEIGKGVQREGLRKFARDLGLEVGAVRSVLDGRDIKVSSLVNILSGLDLNLAVEAGEWTVDANTPLVGVAKCGVQGSSEIYEGRDALPMPSWIDDPKAFWVLASGKSMEKEGIRSGDYCLISPARIPRQGDRVYVRDLEDKVVIKRLLSMEDSSFDLQGWQDPRDGSQTDFGDKRFTVGIKDIFPVVAVYRGRPGNEKREAVFIPDPRVQGLPRHDGMVLIEVMIDSLVAERPPGIPTTLGFNDQWLRAIGLRPENAALVAVIDGDMEPTFSSRSIALINRALQQVEPNAVYAIRTGSQAVLRRLEALTDGTLIIRGDNPKAESSVLPKDRAGEVEILGKVVWCGHHF